MTRKEAIKELQESHDMMRSYNIDENESRLMTALNMAIQALSQEPKSGKWIDKEFRKEEYVLAGKCSVCGRVRVIDEFCSHCGAKMESEVSNG